MKVAILGPSTSALEIAQKLHELGASVRLYWGPDRSSPALAALREANVIVPHPWARVTKRFLLPGATPPSKNRFSDLFRVVHLVDPKPIIERGMAEQPEVYEKMSEDFLSSLTGQLEMFEDVDVVIDAAARVPRMSMGPGGVAVGESKLREGSHVVMQGQTNLREWVGQVREVAIVGAGEQACHALLQLKDWLDAHVNNRVFVITAETTPFDKPSSEMQAFLTHEATLHAKELELHKVSDAAWLELDDFIQAKKPRPEIPIPRFVVFSGHVVTAADQLVDQSRTFLTCETMPWIKGEMHPENNGLDLKTIGVDKVIVATGTRRSWERFQGLDLLAASDGKDSRSPDGSHPEVGFFTLPAEDASERQLQIIHQLQKLFSRAEGSV